MRAGSTGSNTLVFVYGTLIAASLGKVIPSVVPISHEMGIRPAQAAWLISIVMIVQFFFAPFVGYLNDRFSERKLLAVGIALNVVGSIGGAVSSGFLTLLASRLVEGLAFFLVMNSCLTLLMRTNSGARRSAVSATYVAFVSLGIAVSTALAAQVGELGWRTAFWAHAGIMAVSLLGCAYLPPTATQQLASGEDETFLWAYRHLPPIWLGVVIAFVMVLVFGAPTLVPTHLMATDHISIGVAATITAFGQSMQIVGNLISGALLARGARATRIALYATTLAAPAGILTFLPVAGVVASSTSLFAFQILGGSAISALTSLVPAVSRTSSHLGGTNAIVSQFSGLGILLGPPLMFTVYELLGGFGAGAIATGCVVAALATLLTTRLMECDAVGIQGIAMSKVAEPAGEH